MAKILIIRGGALGDFILTLPAIGLIRKTFPEVHLEILGYPNVTPLAEFTGLADATRSMEHGPLSLFFTPGATLPDDLVKYFSSFSAVISYLYDPDGYFESNVRKCGVDNYIRAPYKMAESTDDPPAAFQLAKPLEQMALYLEEPWIQLSFPGSENVEGSALPEAPDNQRPVIAIHPGSGSPRKNWSLESWVQTATRIAEAIPEAQFLFVSGEAEDRTISDFLDLASSANLKFRHLSHPTLEDLTRELTCASVYLGHDTGVSHLAAATGIPSVLLFGPTNPNIWAPQNPSVQVIQAPHSDLSRLKSDAIASSAIELLHTLR